MGSSPPGATKILFCLDRSGSMASILGPTLEGFNSYVETLQKDAAVLLPYRFSLMLFDSDGAAAPCFDFLAEDQPIAAILPLNTTSYQPRGGTPLFDAIEHGASVLDKHVTPEDKALVVILTDGEENTSKKIKTSDEVKNIVAMYEARGNWSFVFMGTELAAYSAGKMGIATGNIASFGMTGQSVNTSYKNITSSTVAYASSGASSSALFFADPATVGVGSAPPPPPPPPTPSVKPREGNAPPLPTPPPKNRARRRLSSNQRN